MVKLDLHHVPLNDVSQPDQITELILSIETIRGLVGALTMAAVRAEQDARVGLLPTGE